MAFHIVCTVLHYPILMELLRQYLLLSTVHEKNRSEMFDNWSKIPVNTLVGIQVYKEVHGPIRLRTVHFLRSEGVGVRRF